MNAGFGAGLLTGSLGDHFTPTFNFIFGFDFAYRNSILYVNATLAGDKVKKDYRSERSWYEGQRAGVAIMDISYGYAIVDNERIKLSPFAGLGVTEFTGTNKDDKENGLRMVDYSMVFGINTGYKLWTRLKLVPNFGIKEKVDTSIRARLYITHANYQEDLQGYSINLTIGNLWIWKYDQIKMSTPTNSILFRHKNQFRLILILPRNPDFNSSPLNFPLEISPFLPYINSTPKELFTPLLKFLSYHCQKGEYISPANILPPGFYMDQCKAH